MQWDLFRTFEVVARLGSLTAASRSLGVSQSTVSRQISKLEEGAGSPLLLRETPIVLTERGAALLQAVLPMVDAALEARTALEATPDLRGLVTLTTVGEMVRWVLSKRLPAFYQRYPHLRLRILADNQIKSLAAGEADIAVRLAKPTRGELVVRKLHTETYAFYASSTRALGPDVPWLGLAGSIGHIPEQRYAERAFRTRRPRLLVEDLESLGLVVESGLGVALLPRMFAARLQDVIEVKPTQIGAQDIGDLPSRDFWMVVHQSKQHIPKIRAVMDWLVGEKLTSGQKHLGSADTK